MPRKIVTFAAALLGLAAAFLSINQAKASEWGCEVLLCAASSNPSWQQIPFCQRPMNKLIACLSKRSPCSWPVCTQAGTGAPGHQPFENCPAGWSPTSGQSGRDGNGIGLNQCRRPVQNVTCSGRDCDGIQYEYRARPRKADPYFFKIKDDTTGQIGTHYFNLRK